MKNIAIQNAGTGGVKAVFWLGPTKLGDPGADGCVMYGRFSSELDHGAPGSFRSVRLE